MLILLSLFPNCECETIRQYEIIQSWTKELIRLLNTETELSRIGIFDQSLNWKSADVTDSLLSSIGRNKTVSFELMSLTLDYKINFIIYFLLKVDKVRKCLKIYSLKHIFFFSENIK